MEVEPKMRTSRSLTATHAIVKWNATEGFQPDTIAAHARIIDSLGYVWWGKIAKTGHLGMTKTAVVNLCRGDKKHERHLYLSCPDAPKATLHVGKVESVSLIRPTDESHIPAYYSRLPYPIPYWFKISDLRELTTESLENLRLLDGQTYDPVASNAYPLAVHEKHSRELFDYVETSGRKWFELQGLHELSSGRADLDPKLVFALIPFHESFEDAWELGIRRTVEKLSLVCKRALDIQHNRSIMEVVCESIRSARLVIADMTDNNPNVFYELGYAHALHKPVILITRDTATVPFDLKGINHIQYKNATDLGNKLPAMIDAVMRTNTRARSMSVR
jgi:hypothetical protein